MSDNDHTRQRIVASVFDKRNAGSAVKESYVAHVKIWEDAGESQGKKPRYILLSSASTASYPRRGHSDAHQGPPTVLVSYTSPS